MQKQCRNKTWIYIKIKEGITKSSSKFKIKKKQRNIRNIKQISKLIFLFQQNVITNIILNIPFAEYFDYGFYYYVILVSVSYPLDFHQLMFIDHALNNIVLINAILNTFHH